MKDRQRLLDILDLTVSSASEVELGLGLEHGDDGLGDGDIAGLRMGLDARGDIHPVPEESQSAGATCPNLLSRQERTVLIGVETGGGSVLQTAGGIMAFKLPNSGLILDVPLNRGVVAGDASSFGRGVIPDVDVRRTNDDLAAGRDPVLDCAKALATGGSCKAQGTASG
jgi:hypothetical protein